MKNKTQILIIHGGSTFKNKKDYLSFLMNKEINIKKKEKWSGEYLEKQLGENFEIIRPLMPLKENAKYSDWKIFFERHFPFLRDDVILIGNSLGGIFLAKYLSENKFPKKILSAYLVCPPFEDVGKNSLSSFKNKKDLSLIERNCSRLYLLFSEDDDIVPISHAEKYREKLKNAKIIIYKSKKGHFRVSKFPEIIKMIKGDVNQK